MKAVGVIVEYNPFHNGHHYHLNESKKKSAADVAIAVMSGYFLQRGEPALVSKWLRTKMALQGGADLVVELPYAFSTGKAEVFANGAISILSALQTDDVCFGSEEGNVEPFYKTLAFLQRNETTYQHHLKAFLAEGNSFPKASSLAFQRLNNHGKFLDLSKPNNILGFHYIKATEDQGSSIKAKTIARTGADFHDPEFEQGEIASATSIRKAVFREKNDLSSLKPFVPNFTYQTLLEALKQQEVFHRWENFFPLLQHQLLTKTADELRQIYEVEEGLEHRLRNKMREAKSFSAFIERVKTKRYTWTRLQRLCVHILTNTTKADMKQVLQTPKATYIRLLGMTEKGQVYLNDIKKELSLPLISRLSHHEDPLLSLDKKAADCYSLGYLKPLRLEKMQEEYATPPIRFQADSGVFK